MAFSGDLKHLPIVDVVQLLNTSRRSGILTVSGRRGESQLVFKDGYIVSASHLNGSVRIGQVLVERGSITPETLQQALTRQTEDGAERKPLVVTLMELGLVDEEDAYRGLEQLIELTLVEILTWKSGKFILEPLDTSVVCAFRYYPEKMDGEVNVSTQGILMDALRVYDEKMRDGLITEEPDDEPIDITALLSADDLGLSDMEERETVLPAMFEGLKPFDPTLFQRDRLAEVAPGLAPGERDELAAFLADYTPDPDHAATEAPSAGASLVFFSGDPLMRHLVTALCAHGGVEIASAGGEEEIEQAVGAAGNGELPLLVLDAPGTGADRFTPDRVATFHQLMRLRHPALTVIQLASPASFRFTLHAYGTGARAVLPCPLPEEQQATYVRDLISFLETFSLYLQGMGTPG